MTNHRFSIGYVLEKQSPPPGYIFAQIAENQGLISGGGSRALLLDDFWAPETLAIPQRWTATETTQELILAPLEVMTMLCFHPLLDRGWSAA